jgi:hypothetical protein
MPSGGSSAELFYSAPPKNQWAQLVYTRTSGVMKFYKNGVLQSSINNTTNFSSSFNLRISANSASVLEPSRQKVMIFRQYNRGLSPSEVLQNYNASVGKTTSTGFTALTDSCGSCSYNYNHSLNEWQYSSDSCTSNCSCPTENYVNSNNSPLGCAGEADYTSCEVPCESNPYINRSFVSFNTSEINKIDFNYVLQTDASTLRTSEDGSLTFVKWTGSTPSFIGDLTTKQSIVGYNQVTADLNNSSSWSVSEDTPTPYLYLNLLSDQENSIIEW